MRGIYILLFSALIMLPSCKEIFFDDEVQTREIKLDHYNAVSIKGIYNILLVQDSTERIIIRGKNRISSVEAEIFKDTLWIGNHTFSLEPARNTLEIHFAEMGYLLTQHPVNISVSDTIKADAFSYFAFGEIEQARLIFDCKSLLVFGGHNTLGNFRICGKSDFADLSVRYGASMDARELKCTKAEVYNSSAGDIYVNASGSLRAYISGTGNIFYYGNPALEIMEKTGEGRLISIH